MGFGLTEEDGEPSPDLLDGKLNKDPENTLYQPGEKRKI
jgi:hypothetical protein